MTLLPQFTDLVTKFCFVCFLNFSVVPGETFQNTSWINHFETQNIKIGGLNNELYEFKTVGRNDYPDDNDVNSRSESSASDVTEGRPLRSTTGKYRTLLTEQHSLGNVSALTVLGIRNPLWESWILYSRFLVLDYSLCQWNLDSGFYSLVGFRIPWAVLLIPKPTIPDSTAIISRILKSGFPYLQRAKCSGIISIGYGVILLKKEEWEMGTQQMGGFHLS